MLATRTTFKRSFSTSSINLTKVSVLGATGGIGKLLPLLLKENPYIAHLSLYDIVNTHSVAADLSYVHTNTKVTGHTSDNVGLKTVLQGAQVVVVTEGAPRNPGMTYGDLFNARPSVASDLAVASAK